MPPGTVMLTKRAPVGAVVVNTVPMATNQGFLNFTCGPALLPAFLAAWLKANKPYLDAVANGSTYPELYLADLFEFEIGVPSVHDQQRIVEVTNAFQVVLAMGSSLEQLTVSPEELYLVQTKARKLRMLRETLLPLLISGEVALPDVSEVPVSLSASSSSAGRRDARSLRGIEVGTTGIPKRGASLLRRIGRSSPKLALPRPEAAPRAHIRITSCAATKSSSRSNGSLKRRSPGMRMAMWCASSQSSTSMRRASRRRSFSATTRTSSSAPMRSCSTGRMSRWDVFRPLTSGRCGASR